MKKLSMFQPAVLLAVLCLIVTLLLAGTNELTKEPIAIQQKAAALEQMKKIYPEGESFPVITLSEEQTVAMAERDITADQISTVENAAGDVLGYVFITSSRGYAGNVVATTGIDKEGRLVMVTATAADDTPGLGKRVEENSFLAQFSGFDSASLTSVTGEPGTQKIDSISGATISSKAASAAVNKAMGAYAYLKEEGLIS